MVPNSLQWRWIDLCVKQIDRRLLFFPVHWGVWCMQATLIKLTVHHDCFYWRNKDYKEYGDWKKCAFRIRAQEGKGHTFAMICSQFVPIFAVRFLKHLSDTFSLPSYILLFFFHLSSSLGISPLFSPLIGWTAEIDQHFFKGQGRKQKVGAKALM